MTTPTISFLITYYNEKHLLTECLQSVYNQTVLPDEVVIYDDASSYPARDYVIHHPQVPLRIIEGKKNIMLAGARNELMKAASCEFIHYQDADDLLEPFCIERIKIAIQSGVASDVVVNEVRSVSLVDRSPISDRVMSLSSIRSTEQLLIHAIGGSLLAPSTTFRKSFGLQLGGYKASQLLQSEDFEFNIRLIYYAGSCKIITDPLVIQRIRPNSMSSNRSELYREALKAILMLSRELPMKYHQYLGSRASSIGRLQYSADKSLAKMAFGIASQLSPVPYANENMWYRAASFLLGQFSAEKITHAYRCVLPSVLRKNLSGIVKQA